MKRILTTILLATVLAGIPVFALNRTERTAGVAWVLASPAPASPQYRRLRYRRPRYGRRYMIVRRPVYRQRRYRQLRVYRRRPYRGIYVMRPRRRRY